MRIDGELDPECGDEKGPPSRTRSRLKRRQQQSNKSKPKQRKKEFEELDELNQVSLTLQPQLDKEKANCKDQSANNGQPSVSLSTPFVPEKQTFELILDALQRRDTYEIFAEPVDPDEVEDYYEIITEPMDFGTMRAKLHEGMYKTLEQFEHDVFLISRNAMHFNSSATIFFRQARAINELSKKIFHVLRNDPGNFISEFSGTRRRSSRRPQCESKDLNYKSCAKISKTEKPGSGSVGASSSRPLIYRRNNRGGIRDYDAFRDSSDTDRRGTYQPPNISTDLGPLVLMNQRDLSYSESLMMFLKDLGPTAQTIANRKLNGSSVNNTADYRIETPLSHVSSAFTSSGIKPSTQDTILSNPSHKLFNLFPWSQTIRGPASDIIDLTNADDEEKPYYTSAKILGNFGSEEMNIFRVLSPRNQMGSYSPKLADKANIFGNNGANSNVVTLALPADLRRKNNDSTSSSWLAQASGVLSLSQTSGSTESLNSAVLTQTAQPNQYLEPNRLVTSAPGFGFDLPSLQFQLNYIGHDNMRQLTLHSEFKNYTHQVESNNNSYFNGQSCKASFDTSDTDLTLQL